MMRPGICLVLVCAALAHADGDVVELKNGDRLSGTITKMTDDTLTGCGVRA